MMTAGSGSASLEQPGYWWHRARADLLQVALERFLGEPRRVLDVGSADGPSVGWMRGFGQCFAIDVVPRGLVPGLSVCGSALALPFADETFDAVAAFDVLEHCEPERHAIAELNRVLVPGGRLLMSVPAYQWAWTDHDERAGHYRRYTRPRLVAAVEAARLDVRRSTYAFSATFPFFIVERIMRRLRRQATAETARLTQVPPAIEKVLMAAASLDRRILNKHDLPFGSSIFVAAAKKAHPPDRHEESPDWPRSEQNGWPW
jgi:SAM-dependent methyltransferase